MSSFEFPIRLHSWLHLLDMKEQKVPIDVLMTTGEGGKETVVGLLMCEKDIASVLFLCVKFTLVLESVDSLILFAVLIGLKFWEGKELEFVRTVWYVGFIYHLLDGNDLYKITERIGNNGCCFRTGTQR